MAGDAVRLGGAGALGLLLLLLGGLALLATLRPLAPAPQVLATTFIPRPTVSSFRRASLRPLGAGSDVDDFRRKLVDGVTSSRRFEKWTSTGRQAKAIREALQEAAADPTLADPEEPKEEAGPTADPTTLDSFTFGDAGMERAEMQPANELEDLRSRPLSTWPEKGDAFFAGRVAAVFFGALAFLLVWIAVSSEVGVDQVGLAYAFLLAAAATTLLVFRLWSDWGYVGARLRDPKVFYEKSGWYDGELWEKPAAVASRDRLLYAYQVRPVVDRLRTWLLAGVCATALAFAALLNILPSDPFGEVVEDGKSSSAPGVQRERR